MNIDKKEILRYLGYQSKKVDIITEKLMDEAVKEINESVEVHAVYEIFDIEKLPNKVLIKETPLIFEGMDIRAHLENSQRCAVMAVTLGNIMDQKIRYYSKIDLTKSIIFDAAATAAVESACDRVEDEIILRAKEEGLHTTYRYSPGYGDFSLSIQPQIIHILDASRKIGLSVTDTLILTPRKSVTAIIGLQNNAGIYKSNGCERCNHNKTCTYKKDGEFCGAKKNYR